MDTLGKYLFLTLMLCVGMTANLSANSNQKENRNLKGFESVQVSSGIDLYLTMDDNEKVVVEADEDVIDKIITEVKSGTLHIYMKKSNWFGWGKINAMRKVHVSVKQLESLKASSGSDVRSENRLEGEELEISASSGSDVVLDVFYKHLSIGTSSGSDAELKGKVKFLKAESSSGSDINAKGLESQICEVSSSSGSDVAVTVHDELYARASSGADIKYYGNPQVRDIEESSGGDVRKK